MMSFSKYCLSLPSEPKIVHNMKILFLSMVLKASAYVAKVGGFYSSL